MHLHSSPNSKEGEAVICFFKKKENESVEEQYQSNIIMWEEVLSGLKKMNMKEGGKRNEDRKRRI